MAERPSDPNSLGDRIRALELLDQIDQRRLSELDLNEAALVRATLKQLWLDYDLAIKFEQQSPEGLAPDEIKNLNATWDRWWKRLEELDVGTQEARSGEERTR